MMEVRSDLSPSHPYVRTGAPHHTHLQTHSYARRCASLDSFQWLLSSGFLSPGSPQPPNTIHSSPNPGPRECDLTWKPGLCGGDRIEARSFRPARIQRLVSLPALGDLDPEPQRGRQATWRQRLECRRPGNAKDCRGRQKESGRGRIPPEPPEMDTLILGLCLHRE